MSHCREETKTTEVRFIDLTRELVRAEVENFDFNEDRDLKYHWKKNQGRYSGLKRSERWKNTQVTFLKNNDVFQNESKDSILFSPGSKYKFSETNGRFTFKFALGFLGRNGISRGGIFRIYSNSKLLAEWDLSNESQEKWFSYQQNLELNTDLVLEWKSEDSFLFLGNPILIPEEFGVNGYNLVFIVVDSLRSDALGCMGMQFPLSPQIDKFCKESIVFENHFVNANWTKPSMLSMFFGEYASNLGITNTGFSIYPVEKEILYNLSIKNIVSILREKGYYTESIMNNVFLLDYTGVGIDLGFHELSQIGKDIVDTEVITEESLSFLKNLPSSPFFLHINYNTPHGSYSPPESISKILESESSVSYSGVHPIIKRYYGEVRYTDVQVGKIIEQLKNQNLYDNTFIILTADHGDLFDEKHTFASNGVFGSRWGHGETHYDEEIRVPLLIKPPTAIQSLIKNRKIRTASSSVSIVPTLLALMGVENTKSGKKGKDYSPLILENKEVKEDFIYTEGRLSESFRTDDFKYVRRYPGFTNYLLGGAIPSSEKMEEIFDLKNDPNEYYNIAWKNPEVLSELRNLRKTQRLKKNSFYLSLPPSDQPYSGQFYISGGIYDVDIPESVQIQFGNRFYMNFRSEPGKSSLIRLYTNEPIYEFQLKLLSGYYPSKLKAGAWGVPAGEKVLKEKRFLFARVAPPGFETTKIPWIYNDFQLSGNSLNGETAIMADEVKNILKSWGYIHE
ncbi:MAG: sulfatase [Leptospiraceae bacterium]|nr:sulfatase [Leptospiraceae bacterium]MCP5512254.1 sulfatase [Leptospiraceae bacterium]